MKLPNNMDNLARIGMFAPALYDRAQKQNDDAKAARYRELRNRAVDWTDDLPFAEDWVVRGETYPSHRLVDLPRNRDSPRIPRDPACRLDLPGGKYYYDTYVKPGVALDTYAGRRRGHLWFTAEVTIPVLSAGIPGAKRLPKVWMSAAPTEVFSQRAGVRLATGTVVVGGLGLGWFLRKVCQKKSVDRVVVVENDAALLATFRPLLCERYPELAKVSDWVRGDALDHVGRHGDGARYLLDIWAEYGEWDDRYEALRRTTRHLWGWGQGGSLMPKEKTAAARR